MSATDWQTAAAALRISAQLVDGIQDGMVRRGFVDVRPVHGFAFGVLSEGPTTTSGLAAAMGISKQAAAQLVDHLVHRGYLSRESDPRDGRAQLLVMTARGHACTAAAEQSAAEVVQSWRKSVPAQTFPVFVDVLHGIARPGRLRPAW